MRTAIAELVRTAASTLLAHQAAGRHCDPESLRWAQRVLAQNAPAAPPPKEIAHGTCTD